MVDASAIQRNLAAFAAVWEHLALPEQRELLALLLQEVRYDPAQGQIRLRMRHLPDVGEALRAARFR